MGDRQNSWRTSVAELLNDVHDGARVGVCGFHFTRLPMAQLRELSRRRRDLVYVAWGGGLALELLLSAGAVSGAELTFSSLDIFGLAPRFRRAMESETLELREWTALGMIKALQARSQHLGFEVMPQLAGTDLGQWSAPLEDPFPRGGGVPQAAVPELVVDVLLLHASRADDAGNVEIRGARGLDLSLMFAADRVLVTVERRVRVGALGAPGAFVLPRTFVSGVTVAEFGAYPTSCLPEYPADLRRVASIARLPAGEAIDDALLTADRAARARLRATAQVDSERLLESLAREGADADVCEGPATREEVMVCALARTLDASSVATVGSASPLPTVAYLLAKLLRLPDLMIMSFNGGLVDIAWRPMTLSCAELLDVRSAAVHAGGDETYHWYYQQGRITHEVVSTAQLDPTGASNTIAIRRSDGRLLRLPGQGGMADVANLHANYLLYLPRQDARNTVPRVDIRGASRVWHDPALRERYRLAPGTTAVFTDLGQFAYDARAESLVLTHVHPGVSVAEVRERCGWPLVTAPDVAVTPAPTTEELQALRHRVDPLGIRRLELVGAEERQALIDAVLDAEERALRRAASPAAQPTGPGPPGRTATPRTATSRPTG